MVFNRYHLYLAISITFWVDFVSVHDVLIILLMYHISAASILLSRSFVMYSIHIHVEGWTICRLLEYDFGLNSDISISEDGLHLCECVFKQSYYFLYFSVTPGVWTYCDAQIFKSAYLFYSVPYWKECFIKQCLTVLRWPCTQSSLYSLEVLCFHFRLWLF